MHADLVGAPRKGEDGKKTVRAVGSESKITGMRGGAALVCLAQDHTLGRATDGKGDLALPRCLTVYQREISLLDPSLPHGERKTVRRMGGARRKNDTACLTVKAGDGTEDVRTVAVSVGEGIGEGVVIMPVRGMRRHISRLGTDGDVAVLIQKGEGKVARDEIFVCLLVLQRERKEVALMQYRAHRDSRAVL